MRRLLLPLVALLAVIARADEPAPARFRLKAPEEALRLARLTGKVAPTGRLALLADGSFVLEAEGVVRKGRFRDQDGRLALTADDGAELSGRRDGDRVTVEGFAFEKESPLDLAGAWTTRRDGFEEKGLRMELRKDGTFRFKMAGATSEGTWSALDGKLVLVWTKIDGEAVETGTVKKAFPVSADGVSFQIDRYRYERSTVQ